MPSVANGAGNGEIDPVALSASARWMPVSCACRRAQNATGDGAGRNVQHSRSRSADSRVRTSRSRPWSYHSRRPSSSGSGPATSTAFRIGSARRSATCAPAQRWTSPMWRTRSRICHSGQVGMGTPSPVLDAVASRSSPSRRNAWRCSGSSTLGSLSVGWVEASRRSGSLFARLSPSLSPEGKLCAEVGG